MDEDKKTSKNSRLLEIIKVLTSHNVLINLARQTNPAEVREALEKLGPTFIKLGQLLSIRDDIISEEYIDEFRKLQDDVKADDFNIVKKIIEETTNMNLSDVFEELNEEPLASASIGQVHYARLLSGKEVVVKIQHPGIYEKMSTDIELLEKAIPLIKFIPSASTINPYDMMDELKKSLLVELDFNKEVDNIERFYNNNLNEDIICPKVYKQFSYKNLLIMDFMRGVKISDYIAEKDEEVDGIDKKKKIADTLVTNYIKQIFQDGFFHADPHPGNILVCEDKLVYLDFGMMGELDEKTIEKLNNIVAALVKEDDALIAKAILGLCKHSKDVNMDALTIDVGRLFSKYYDMSIGDMNLPEIFTNVTRVCSKNRLILPSNVALLFKGISTVEGIMQRLDPSFSFMTAIEPYAYNYLIHKFDFQKESLQLLKSLIKLIRFAPDIPVKLSKLLDEMLKGKFNFSSNKAENSANISLSIIIGALIIGSSVALQDDKVFNFGTVGLLLSFALSLFLLYNIYKK
ncbi:MAG: AarF/UbiB family protein [Oscillospiraceae bacterium]|nr:AarF/UbiB family protein [Oscillospiraceae bacterium]